MIKSTYKIFTIISGGAISFFSEIWDKKYAIYQLVRRDLTERYIGSYFGLVWVIIQQVIMVVVMWFVLQFGLRVQPAGNIPFLAWIVPAMAIWTLFSEALNTASNSLISYAYIVKKIQFKLSILPLIKVFSAAVIHCLFLVIVIMVLIILKVSPSFCWLQSIYYFFACICLVLGMGWLMSAIMVFFRDLAAGIGILLNILMWVTPIYWNMDILPPRFKILCYLNPVSYLTEGYRKSFLYKTPFWNDPLWTAYFWGITLCFMTAGILLFRKLKPHFADVL